LIDRTMTLWSRVFRRAFLSGLGVALPPGIHEDVPLSATALIRAARWLEAQTPAGSVGPGERPLPAKAVFPPAYPAISPQITAALP